MNLKNLIFFIVCLIHIFIWIFILLAFLNKKFALFNIYYLIPLIYIAHILPFHILIEIKKCLFRNNFEEKVKKIDSVLIIPKYFQRLMNNLHNKCTFSPISPQGMMIFGLISSIFSLKYIHN